MDSVSSPDTVGRKYYIFFAGEETTYKHYLANPTSLEPEISEPGNDAIFPRD